MTRPTKTRGVCAASYAPGGSAPPQQSPAAHCTSPKAQHVGAKSETATASDCLPTRRRLRSPPQQQYTWARVCNRERPPPLGPLFTKREPATLETCATNSISKSKTQALLASTITAMPRSWLRCGSFGGFTSPARQWPYRCRRDCRRR